MLILTFQGLFQSLHFLKQYLKLTWCAHVVRYILVYGRPGHTCARPMSGKNRFLFFLGRITIHLMQNWVNVYLDFFLLSSSALCQHGNCSYLVSRIFINLDIFFHRQIEFMLWEKSHFSSPNYKIQIWNGKITFVLPKIEYQCEQNYKSASNVFTVTTNLYCYLLNYCIFAPINNQKDLQR